MCDTFGNNYRCCLCPALPPLDQQLSFATLGKFTLCIDQISFVYWTNDKSMVTPLCEIPDLLVN